MKLVFRVDASIDIGSGHVMRCLALAEYQRSMGTDCYFICRNSTGNLSAVIGSRGFHCIELPACKGTSDEDVRRDHYPVHRHWLGCRWETDAEQVIPILSELKPDWLVVDHYSLDCRWEKMVRPFVGQVMVIDDLADRSHDCELLLDQNLGRQTIDYKSLISSGCILLVGPQYALLRSDFALLREYSFRRRQLPSVRKILVSMGGFDKQNATTLVLESLERCSLPQECCITVVMGVNSPWLENVKVRTERMDFRISVQTGVTDMASLMADSDLAIGASGSTTWERCCLGLPTIMTSLAANQSPLVIYMAENGITKTVEMGDNFVNQLALAIDELVECPGELRALSIKSRSVTSGAGCRLVSDALS